MEADQELPRLGEDQNSVLPLQQIRAAGATRRQITIWASGILTGAASIALWDGVDGAKKQLLDYIENRDFISEHLFGQSLSAPQTDKNFIVSTNNPYSKIIGRTAPTMEALNDLRRALHMRETTEQISEEVIISELDGHVIIFGGPVANIYARQYLGWGAYSPLLKFANADLKYKFTDCLVKKLRDGYKPDFRIRCPSGDFLEGKRGVDYLLISSFPNVHSAGFDLGYRVLIVSGMHGAGTRAFGHLLSQPNLLKVLPSFSASKQVGWQCLIEVCVNESGRPTGELRVVPPEFIEGDYNLLRKQMQKDGSVFPIDPHDPYSAPA